MYDKPERATYLIEVLKNLENVQRVAEVGVWKGKFSRCLLENIPSIKEYHLIDPWELYQDYLSTNDSRANSSLSEAYTYCKRNLEKFESKLIWHKEFSSEAVKKFTNNYFDFVFIDGNHAYEYVKQDIELWLPKIRSRGIISGHDLDYPGFNGVRKAVEETLKDNWYKGKDYVWWTKVAK